MKGVAGSMASIMERLQRVYLAIEKKESALPFNISTCSSLLTQKVRTSRLISSSVGDNNRLLFIRLLFMSALQLERASFIIKYNIARILVREDSLLTDCHWGWTTLTILIQVFNSEQQQHGQVASLEHQINQPQSEWEMMETSDLLAMHKHVTHTLSMQWVHTYQHTSHLLGDTVTRLQEVTPWRTSILAMLYWDQWVMMNSAQHWQRVRMTWTADVLQTSVVKSCCYRPTEGRRNEETSKTLVLCHFLS